MKRNPSFVAIVLVALFVLSSCATPTPQVIEKIVTQQVDRAVPQTVVVQQTVEKQSTVVVTKVVDRQVTTTPATVQKPVTLDMVLNSEPSTLDPNASGDGVSYFMYRQLFMSLVALNDKGEAVPELATKWSANADGTVWTFTLRTDVKWVQYTPATAAFKDMGTVKAKDVVYGVKHTLDPRVGGMSASGIYIIKGAEAFNGAKPDAANFQALMDAVGVKAVDDTTVEFTLTEPATYFPQLVAGAGTKALLEAAITAHPTKWTEPGWIATNGPYALAEWLHGSRMTLIKNPLWFDAAKVQIEVVNAPVVGEASTAMGMYETNAIDFMGDPGWDVPLPDLQRVKADAKLSKEYINFPRPSVYYYVFNVQKKPFDNVLVRRAFSAAIDRKSLVANVTKGGEAPAKTFTPPGIAFTNAADPTIGSWMLMANYADQVKQAQAWLAQAGYPEGAGMGEVHLMISTSQMHSAIAQAIQGMWQAAFPKLNLKIDSLEFQSYLAVARPTTPLADQPPILRAATGGSYPDQSAWMRPSFWSKSTSNWSRYVNPTFDDLITKAGMEKDPVKRQDLYRQAETLAVVTDAAVAPIYWYVWNRLHKPYLTAPIGPVTGHQLISTWKIDVAAKNAARGIK